MPMPAPANPFEAFRCRKIRGGVAEPSIATVSTATLRTGRAAASNACAAASAGKADEGVAGPAQAASLSLDPADNATAEEAGAGASAVAAQDSAGVAVKQTRSRKRKAAASAAVCVEGGPPKGVPERLGDRPLRLILVGHNPSDHAWRTGHYYSNPSNWMWRLLKETGIAPSSIRGAEDDARMPAEAGVGFVDVGCGVPGTASNQFTSEVVAGWAQGFYIRLANHMRRASDSIGCSCGACGAPAVVAFTGKRQFSELVNHGKKGKAKIRVELGPQTILPQGWPLPATTEVWVLTSTSGASPMTNADRKAPYQQLADRIANELLDRDANTLLCCASRSVN